MTKERKGVALGYSSDDQAPRVLAVARGILVDKMIRIAEEKHITVYRDADLTEVLSAVPPGTEIPENLYRAVAEVLTYCYRVNSEFREKLDSMGNR